MIASYGISEIVFSKVYEIDDSSLELAGEFDINITQVKDDE